MYAYEWDSSTGGYILTPMPLAFSKEPRPVYYKELDILGFDKYWDYDKNDSFPYMWAEANNYYYRGRLVAKTKGGSLYTPPELVLIEDPEPEGYPLRFVDIHAMVDKNRQLMEQLVQETIKKIYNTFIEYKDKVDVSYVAFSGGKDSVVTLDLVQRALPHNEFKVLFGDTGMEFPDTYDVVEKIKCFCEEEKIVFLVSKSELSPLDSWRIFGPPAQTMRWCCSVHKTAPQIIKLREYTNIGTIEPIKELATVAHDNGILFHTDAVQAVGHIPIDVSDLCVDMLSASAHKFNGPKGIGFLYIKRGTKISSFADGGAQEFHKRAGTENIASIVGMAIALKKSCDEMKKVNEKLLALDEAFNDVLLKSRIDFIRNGSNNRVPGNINLSIRKTSGEMLLHRLDLMGICISTGSACDSVNTEVSHVIKAIGVPFEYSEGTIRISFGRDNTEEDAVTIAKAIVKVLKGEEVI